MTKLSPEIQKRLATEANIWIASIRPDGRPHLTPVWFIWRQGKLYSCIQAGGVKTRNIEQNSGVVLALEDGSSPVICEGVAKFLPEPWPEAVVDIFRAKYHWDITTDSDYDRLLEVTPVKWLVW